MMAFWVCRDLLSPQRVAEEPVPAPPAWAVGGRCGALVSTRSSQLLSRRLSVAHGKSLGKLPNDLANYAYIIYIYVSPFRGQPRCARAPLGCSLLVTGGSPDEGAAALCCAPGASPLALSPASVCPFVATEFPPFQAGD